MFERMMHEAMLRSNTDGGAAAPLPAAEGVDPNPTADADFDMPLDDDLDSIDVGSAAAPNEGAASGGAPGALGGVPAAPAPAATPAPVQQTQPAQPAPGAPQAAPAGPQQNPQGTPQASQVAQQPAAEQPEPGDFLGQLAQHREAMVEALSERFAISEEDAELLQTQPEAVLPRMAANIMFEAISSVHKQIQEFVPAIIEQHMRVQKAQAEAENAFYSRWPALKGLDGEKFARLSGIIKAYNTSNPQVPRERRIEEIGAIAHQVLGIPIQPVAAAPKRGATPAFRPANGGLPGNAQSTAGEVDEWAGFDLPNS